MTPPFSTTLRWAALGLLAGCGGPAAEDEPVLFIPAEPDAPRLQYLTSVAVDTDIAEAYSGLDIMLFGERKVTKALATPQGMTFRDGVFYVADIQLGVVVTLDFTEGEMDFVRLTGGRAAVSKPVAVAFDARDRFYVADVASRSVLVYDAEWRNVAQLGPFSDRSRIAGVVPHGDRLYLVDPGEGCVRVLALDDYAPLLEIGGPGSEPEERLVGPVGLAVGPDGDLYVSEAIRHRIHVYGPDGTFRRALGGPGNVPGTFSRAKGLAIHDEVIFILDAAAENCQMLDLEGRPLMYFGGSGTERGTFYLPSALWIGAEAVPVMQRFVADGFEAEAILAVTSFYGPQRVSFWAYGRHVDHDYSRYGRPPADGAPDGAPE